MSIVVFGSANMDLVARTPRLPAPGETLIGHTFFTTPGGKGANQAVACARLGAPTTLITRLGGDGFGRELLAALQDDGVDTAQIIVDRDSSSGVAVIAVDDRGENNIIVIPGAYEQLGDDDLSRLQEALAQAQVLLLQLEIPLPIVERAAGMAHEQGVTVILDPAPAQELPPSLYKQIDVLTPNETEAAELVSFPIHNVDDAAKAAQLLLDKGVGRVILKLGDQGAYAAEQQGGRLYPPFPVEVVDSVAAGDAFNAALAVALSEGQPFEEAVRWGAAGGALTVTKEGAQGAMPDRQALERLLAAG